METVLQSPIINNCDFIEKWLKKIAVIPEFSHLTDQDG